MLSWLLVQSSNSVPLRPTSAEEALLGQRGQAVSRNSCPEGGEGKKGAGGEGLYVCLLWEMSN